MVKMNFSDISHELTEEEIAELEAAEKKVGVFDADSPEMTPAMLAQFKKMNQISRVKQTASIRLSEKAQIFSRRYGKGYTSFLSRLIDVALDDEAMVKRCL